MSRVITFSRYFPNKHPKAGRPTYFMEKIHKSLDSLFMSTKTEVNIQSLPIFNFAVYVDALPKHHTIRAGNRWKVGDKFSPRVWSGKPYASKQIQFAPDIEIKKIWEICLDQNYAPSINGKYLFDEFNSENWDFNQMCKNDGLSTQEMIDWFKCHPMKRVNSEDDRTFVGQILCWNESIEY